MTERNISVVVRYRDYAGRERDPETWKLGTTSGPGSDAPPDTITDAQNRLGGITAIFDRVYDPRSGTREVFDNHAKGIVRSCFEGLNGTIFAYGQTASGKTHTMHGDRRTHGVIPYSVLEMYKVMTER